MEIQLSTHEWLKLPMDTRSKLREIFNIPRSQGTVLEDNTVKSDGTTYQDLNAITVEKMSSWLNGDGSDHVGVEVGGSDFVALFNSVIQRIDDEKEVSIAVEGPDPKQLLVDEWVATLNRMKGQAVERQMQDYLQTTVTRLFELKPLTQTHEPNTPKRRGRPKKA